MHVVVASTNPVKVQAARMGFAHAFDTDDLNVSGVAVGSGVSDQPIGDAETLTGALERARRARETEPDADYWVGMEGGVEDEDGVMSVFAWMVVMDAQRVGRGRTAAFVLPDEVARLVREGKELGDADDIVFGHSNSKQKNGSVGLLTGDRVTRTDFYAPAVLLALIPFMNPNLTFPG